ncbi:MAG TPA: DUF4112 domain-containing protein [Tepidisphaeraceae bacterium]|jgi:hypothetical protein
MEAIRVEARRAGSQPLDLEADIRRAESIAKMMDSNFDIGGFKFGLDAVAGLVPVAGDIVTAAIGLYPIYIARKHKLGKAVVARMMFNLGTDFMIGLTPIVGDAADLFFKAHLRNLALLKAAAEKRKLK